LKLFYIVDKETTQHIGTGWHSLDLGNNKLLVCIHWRDEAHEFAWSSREDVMALPHPIYEAATPLAAEHLQHLSGRFALNAGDNIHHVIKQAAREDLWMRCYVL
jgi:hypothetical protein